MSVLIFPKHFFETSMDYTIGAYMKA